MKKKLGNSAGAEGEKIPLALPRQFHRAGSIAPSPHRPRGCEHLRVPRRERGVSLRTPERPPGAAGAAATLPRALMLFGLAGRAVIREAGRAAGRVRKTTKGLFLGSRFFFFGFFCVFFFLTRTD